MAIGATKVIDGKDYTLDRGMTFKYKRLAENKAAELRKHGHIESVRIITVKISTGRRYQVWWSNK